MAATALFALHLMGPVVSSPQSPADTTRAFVFRGATDSALALIATRTPDSLRAALSDLRRSASIAKTDSSRTNDLVFATRLAARYADAWSDSFFVREIARFAASSPVQQRSWALADSLRRAGVTAAARVGVPAAIKLWRRSARAFRSLNDSAGLGSASGNIGAGYYLAGSLDSATAYLERARRLAISVGDRRTEANAVGTLGSVNKDRGNFQQAHALYERALSLRLKSGDGRGAASDRNNLGLIAQELGALDEARADFVAALADNRSGSRAHSAALNLANLATLATLTGDSPGADSLYRQALAIHDSLGELDDQAVVLHDLGLLQMRRADYDGAMKSLRRALTLTDSTGAALEHISEMSDLALLQASRGDLGDGLSILRSAQRAASSARAPAALLARLALTSGDLRFALNTMPEAERDYAHAADLAAAAGDRSLQADAERGRGLLLDRRGRYGDAGVAFAASVRDDQATGDVRAAAAGLLWLGYVQSEAGDMARARRSLNRARAQMHSVGDVAGEAASLSSVGDLEVRVHAPPAAEVAYRRGIELLGARPAPEVAWRLHAGLGEALRARGALPAASVELEAAIASIEHTAAKLRVAEDRESYRADKWDAYATLALNERQRGRVDEAFAVSERLRARQALEQMDRGTVSYTKHDDAAALQEQTLRHRIGELTSMVAGADGPGGALRGVGADSPERDAARAALDELERKYEDFVRDERERNPESVRRVETANASAADVRAELHADEVLLEYLITDSTSTVFVLTRDSVAALDLGLHRREVASLIDYARDAIAHPGVHGEAAWRAPLRRLYRLLVLPVQDAGFLRGRRRLIVVPHAELHFLPFAALMPPGEGDHFLVENVAVLTAPSASLWLRLTRRAVSAAGAVLALAPHRDVLRASRREVDAIADIYGTSTTVLRDAAATREAFEAGAPASSVIHLATLGVLNKQNPLFSFVELSPRGADDGRLTVAEVLALRLHARLVSLSACQTALGSGALADVPAGDEWVGFTSAFLRAGARDVLATLWPVEDNATATLMTEFHRGFAGGAPAADALAQAQRAAIRDPGRAAPFQWAGFVVTGAR